MYVCVYINAYYIFRDLHNCSHRCICMCLSFPYHIYVSQKSSIMKKKEKKSFYLFSNGFSLTLIFLSRMILPLLAQIHNDLEKILNLMMLGLIGYSTQNNE